MITESPKTFTVKFSLPDGSVMQIDNLSRTNADYIEAKMSNPLFRGVTSTITDAECQEAWFKCKSIASHMYRDAVRWTEKRYGVTQRHDVPL